MVQIDDSHIVLPEEAWQEFNERLEESAKVLQIKDLMLRPSVFKSLIAAVLTVALSVVGLAHASRPLQAFNENIPFSTSSAYYPASLPNASHIYDAQVSTMTLSGADITQWNDIVGSAHLTSTAGDYPDYEATGLGGRPTARFDGTDDYMTHATALPTTGDVTIAVVYQVENLDTSLRALYGSASGIGCYWQHDGDYPTRLGCVDGIGHGSFNTTNMTHHMQPEVMVMTFNRTSNDVEMWINGINTTGPLTIWDESGVTPSAVLFLGAYAAASTFPMDGAISHLGIYTSVMSDANIGLLSKFLMNQYNIRPQETIVIDGHSGNTGYAVEDLGDDETKSWPYKMRTAMGTGASAQILWEAIPGEVIENLDTYMGQFWDDVLAAMPYRSRTWVSIFGCGNNINGGDGSVATKLQTYITNRQAAAAYDNISITTEMPNFSSGVATNMLSFNTALRSAFAGTYVPLGATHLVDLQNQSCFTDFTTFTTTGTCAVSDDIHPGDTGTGQMSTEHKSDWGL